MLKHLINLMFVSVLLFVGCTNDDDVVPAPQPMPEPESPTVDVVVSTYGGKVAVLSTSDSLVGYLMKRFSNTTAQLEEGVRVVLMDDAYASGVMANESEWNAISQLWNENGAFIILRPGQNALNMVARLRAEMMSMDYKAVDSNVVESYADIRLYIVKADGGELIYGGNHKQHKQSLTLTSGREEEGGEIIISQHDNVEFVEYQPNDYEEGLIAEAASRWLEKRVEAEPRIMLFSQDASDAYTANRVYREFTTQITVRHDMAGDYKWYDGRCDKYPSNKVVEASAALSVVAGFAEDLKADVYDIQLTQEFEAAKTCVEWYKIHEHLAYNWRYSGGYYYGPTVDLKIKGANGTSFSFKDNTTIISPVPLPQAGSYQLTHYPATATFSGSVTAGANAGSDGLEAGISGGFGMSVTLPTTTVTVSESEMPVTYSDDHTSMQWTYLTNWDLHKVHWGTNPDFNTPPVITSNFCGTNQAVTLMVNNSQQLNEERVYLDYKVDFKTFHELARAEVENHDAFMNWSPEDLYQRLVSHVYTVPTQEMPIVARYFRDYSPACFYSNSKADGIGGWATLETLLDDNIYYSAFMGDAKIRAVTEEGLDRVAEKAWREALTGIVALNNGMDTDYIYIVALTYDLGSHLKVGLYIHNGVWEIVEDVDALKAELVAEAEQNK